LDSFVVGRIQRIYAALGATVEGDLAAFPLIVEDDDESVLLSQDFLGGLSDAQLSNLVHSLIDNIASLNDHARRAYKRAGIDQSKVDDIAKSHVLLVISDLWNNDKHGYPPRNGGNSGLLPQITDVKRILRMTTAGEAGSVTAVTFGRDGMKTTGDGSAEVIVTAEVVDGAGAPIGDLHDLCAKGLKLWEDGLKALRLL